MFKKDEPVLGQIIFALFTLLFLVTPMIVLPWTSELFEIPKMMFVYFITLLIAIVWLMHWPLGKRLPWRRTPLDAPILIFLFTQILATVYSIHPYTSVWGWYSRLHGGLASTLVYIFLFYIFVAVITREQVRLLVKLITWGGLAVAVYGILQHFGIDEHLWVQDVRHRVFATLGQPNWLAAWAVIILPFTYLPLANKVKSEKFKIKSFFLKFISIKHLPNITIYFLPVVYYLTLIYTRSRSGFLAFGISFLLFWVLVLIKNNKVKLSTESLTLKNLFNQLKSLPKPLTTLFGMFLIIGIVSSTPFSASVFDLKDNLSTPLLLRQAAEGHADSSLAAGGTPSGDIRLVVWKGALNIYKRFPILGTGPETFGYTYYWERPEEHNLLSEWDFLYNKAHNEYLNFMANSGTVGLVGYLLLVVSVLYMLTRRIFNLQFSIFNTATSFKSKLPNFQTSKSIKCAILASYVSILITNFFGFSVVVVGIYFWLLPGMAVVLVSNEQISNETAKQRKFENSIRRLFSLIVFLLIMLLCGYGLFWLYDGFKADLEYRTAEILLNADRPSEAAPIISRAVARRPSEALYRDLQAEIYGDLAVISFYTSGEELTNQFERLAVKASEKSLELNPYELNNLKNRASLFITLGTIDKAYTADAVQALEYAMSLSPTDPKLMYNVALLYAREGDKRLAVETLEKSLALKPNYVDSLYAMALFTYEDAVDSDGVVIDEKKASEALDYARKTLEVEPRHAGAKERIEEWDNQIKN